MREREYRALARDEDHVVARREQALDARRASTTRRKVVDEANSVPLEGDGRATRGDDRETRMRGKRAHERLGARHALGLIDREQPSRLVEKRIRHRGFSFASDERKGEAHAAAAARLGAGAIKG